MPDKAHWVRPMNKTTTRSGGKAYQRTDTENRALAYSNFHRTLDRSLLATDVDFIEWRYRDGELVPVGVIEVTRVDKGVFVTETYLKAILYRFEHRDMQAKAARKVAEALGTKAYIVLFREDCSEFWVYCLTTRQGFNKVLTPEQFEDFLKRL
jgi:hypothetical protein